MKFAYLIMAHDNRKQLMNLLKLLDDESNDIYLHLDKKCDITINECFNNVKKAKINVFKRFNVVWGDISQPKLELFLLKKATKKYHNYYHLISGKDLPLKNNFQINAFFEENNGKEFVHFESFDCTLRHAIRYYPPFRQKSKIKLLRRFLNKINNIFMNVQKKKIASLKLYSGANWFSITHRLAVDLCKNKDKVLRIIKYTMCPDEYLIQTFLMQVTKQKYELYLYVENDYKSISREIDWERNKGAHPTIWTFNDYNYLMKSDKMFARKFDEKTDATIIEAISTTLNNG